MTDVKPFTLGDRFFPENKEELQKTIDELFKNIPTDYHTTTRVVLAPHAAYKYSGDVVANALQYFDKRVKNIFIFSPAHYLFFYGIALSPYEMWENPLGVIAINQDLNKEIIERFDAEYNNRAYEQEHAIDVQIPFIQTLLPEAKIVPLLFGNSNFSAIRHIVEEFFGNEENGFIFSSDMTHTYSQEDAQKIDEYNADMIEQRLPADFLKNRSILSTGIIATSDFVREKGFSMIRVALKTSGEIAGSDAKVEGYGSWMVVEENKPQFLKREFSDEILKICKNSIISGLECHNPMDADALKLAPVFDSKGASYVTISVDGKMRGRVGTAFAYQSLKNDLVLNAFNAAFHCEGFERLKEEEIDKMTLEVCLLTRPVAIPFRDKEHLLEKIEEGEGLIVRNDIRQAVFLPCFWYEYPQKEEFLSAILKKAGIDTDNKSKYFEAYKFKVSEIQG